MKAPAFLPILALMLLLAGCEEKVDPREAAIQREVSRQVETIRGEMKTTENGWRTVRVSGFCLLAGGCLIWLLGGQGAAPSAPGSRSRLSGGNLFDQPSGRRIVDRQGEDHDYEREDDPYRR
jgi:hypothetical protein